MPRTSKTELENLTAMLAKKLDRELILEHRSSIYGPYTFALMEPWYDHDGNKTTGQDYFGSGRYYKPAELAAALRLAIDALDALHPGN